MHLHHVDSEAKAYGYGYSTADRKKD